MDFNLLKEGFGLLGTAVAILNKGKDLIPHLEKKQELEKALKEAEEKFGAGKALIAKELGYVLCRCSFPPQIMLTVGDEYHWKCPECDSKIDETKPFIRSGNSGKASEWENFQP